MRFIRFNLRAVCIFLPHFTRVYVYVLICMCNICIYKCDKWKWKCVYQLFYCQCRFRCRHNLIRLNHHLDNVWCHHTSNAFLCINHRHSETHLHYTNKLNTFWASTFQKKRCSKKYDQAWKKWLITMVNMDVVYSINGNLLNHKR